MAAKILGIQLIWKLINFIFFSWRSLHQYGPMWSFILRKNKNKKNNLGKSSLL